MAGNEMRSSKSRPDIGQTILLSHLASQATNIIMATTSANPNDLKTLTTLAVLAALIIALSTYLSSAASPAIIFVLPLTLFASLPLPPLERPSTGTPTPAYPKPQPHKSRPPCAGPGDKTGDTKCWCLLVDQRCQVVFGSTGTPTPAYPRPQPHKPHPPRPDSGDHISKSLRPDSPVD